MKLDNELQIIIDGFVTQTIAEIGKIAMNEHIGSTSDNEFIIPLNIKLNTDVCDLQTQIDAMTYLIDSGVKSIHIDLDKEIKKLENILRDIENRLRKIQCISK